jgi:hypothetical protein
MIGLSVNMVERSQPPGAASVAHFCPFNIFANAGTEGGHSIIRRSFKTPFFRLQR